MARRARGTITAKGDGKWLVRLYAGTQNGARKYTSELVEGGKKDAEKVLTRLLAEKDKGVVTMRGKDTLDTYLDTWLETTAKHSVRPRTLAQYTDTLRAYVRPHLGAVRLSKLAPADVRGMLGKLRDRGLAPRTVRSVHEVLRNALEQAVTDRLLPANPAQSRLVRKALPKVVRSERATISASKVGAFLGAVEGDRLAAYWTTLLFTGLRPGEALALRWTDLNGNVVSVNRVLVHQGREAPYFGEPKSKTSRRTVVLPGIAARALAEHRKRQAAERLKAGAAWNDGGLIFCNEIGEPLRQNATRKRFRRILQAAQLPPMRIYDLRHSCASLLLERGVSLKVASELLGHSSVALTGDTYSHVAVGLQQQAADVLDALA